MKRLVFFGLVLVAWCSSAPLGGETSDQEGNETESAEPLFDLKPLPEAQTIPHKVRSLAVNEHQLLLGAPLRDVDLRNRNDAHRTDVAKEILKTRGTEAAVALVMSGPTPSALLEIGLIGFKTGLQFLAEHKDPPEPPATAHDVGVVDRYSLVGPDYGSADLGENGYIPGFPLDVDVLSFRNTDLTFNANGYFWPWAYEGYQMGWDVAIPQTNHFFASAPGYKRFSAKLQSGDPGLATSEQKKFLSGDDPWNPSPPMSALQGYLEEANFVGADTEVVEKSIVSSAQIRLPGAGVPFVSHYFEIMFYIFKLTGWFGDPPVYVRGTAEELGLLLGYRGINGLTSFPVMKEKGVGHRFGYELVADGDRMLVVSGGWAPTTFEVATRNGNYWELSNVTAAPHRLAARTAEAAVVGNDVLCATELAGQRDKFGLWMYENKMLSIFTPDPVRLWDYSSETDDTGSINQWIRPRLVSSPGLPGGLPPYVVCSLPQYGSNDEGAIRVYYHRRYAWGEEKFQELTIPETEGTTKWLGAGLATEHGIVFASDQQGQRIHTWIFNTDTQEFDYVRHFSLGETGAGIDVKGAHLDFSAMTLSVVDWRTDGTSVLHGARLDAKRQVRVTVRGPDEIFKEGGKVPFSIIPGFGYDLDAVFEDDLVWEEFFREWQETEGEKASVKVPADRAPTKMTFELAVNVPYYTVAKNEDGIPRRHLEFLKPGFDAADLLAFRADVLANPNDPSDWPPNPLDKERLEEYEWARYAQNVSYPPELAMRVGVQKDDGQMWWSDWSTTIGESNDWIGEIGLGLPLQAIYRWPVEIPETILVSGKTLQFEFETRTFRNKTDAERGAFAWERIEKHQYLSGRLIASEWGKKRVEDAETLAQIAGTPLEKRVKVLARREAVYNEQEFSIETPMGLYAVFVPESFTVEHYPWVDTRGLFLSSASVEVTGWTGELKGIVQDSFGAPLAGIQIEAFSGGGMLMGRGVSGSDGWYTIDNLPPRTFTVRPVLPDDHGTDVGERATGLTESSDFMVVSRRQISGKVVTSLQEPVEGMEIVLRREPDGHTRTATTDADGGFQFVGVYDDAYRLAVPDYAGFAVSPPQRSYSEVLSNLTDQDFTVQIGSRTIQLLNGRGENLASLGQLPDADGFRIREAYRMDDAIKLELTEHEQGSFVQAYEMQSEANLRVDELQVGFLITYDEKGGFAYARLSGPAPGPDGPFDSFSDWVEVTRWSGHPTLTSRRAEVVTPLSYGGALEHPTNTKGYWRLEIRRSSNSSIFSPFISWSPGPDLSLEVQPAGTIRVTGGDLFNQAYHWEVGPDWMILNQPSEAIDFFRAFEPQQEFPGKLLLPATGGAVPIYLSPMRTVSGQLKGGPKFYGDFDGFRVVLKGHVWQPAIGDWYRQFMVKCDASGRFTFTVPEGEYDLVAEPGFTFVSETDGTPNIREIGEVAGDITGIAVVVQPTMTVTGTVVADGLTGGDLSGMVVELIPGEGPGAELEGRSGLLRVFDPLVIETRTGTPQGQVYGITDTDGRFSISEVIPYLYRPVVTDPHGRIAFKSRRSLTVQEFWGSLNFSWMTEWFWEKFSNYDGFVFGRSRDQEPFDDGSRRNGRTGEDVRNKQMVEFWADPPTNEVELTVVPQMISFEGALEENLSAGTPFGKVNVDGRGWNFNLLPPSETNDNGLFSIDAAGSVAAHQAFDYETAQRREFSVAVQATRGGWDGTLETTIHLKLQNVPEAPTDILLSAIVAVESSGSDRTVGELTVTDEDRNDYHRLEVVGERHTDFWITSERINTESLQLRHHLRHGPNLDYETASEHRLTIRATDRFGVSFDKEFVIQVEAVNESPKGVLAGGEDIANKRFTIEENTPAGASILTLEAVDPDAGDTHRFELLQSPGQEYFRIDGTQLVVQQAVDFEQLQEGTGPDLQLVVRVSDSGDLSVERRFTIEVLDVDEPPAQLDFVTRGEVLRQIGLSNSSSSYENSQVPALIGMMWAQDPESGAVKFSLVAGEGDGDNSRSFVRGNQLWTSEVLDYEVQSVYELRIRATDPSGLHLERPLRYEIADFDEGPPTGIALDADRFDENLPWRAKLKVTGEPDAGTYRFSLVGGEGAEDNGRFEVRPDGTLRGITAATTSFDYETRDQFQLRVGAAAEPATREVVLRQEQLESSPVLGPWWRMGSFDAADDAPDGW